MILNQIEDISSGREREENRKTARSGSAGVSICKSGHIIVVRPRVNLPLASRPSLSNRGSVAEFTQSSAARMRRYLRETLADYRVLVTLTYPHGLGFDGKRAKRDLKVFFQRLKRRAFEMGGCPHTYGSFWFLEFQNRGAVHFHIFTTHRFDYKWIARVWYEIVGSDDQRHLRAGTRIESIRSGKKGISAYAAKYAAKHVQKIIPEDFGWSGRFWGAVGFRATVAAATYVEPTDALGLAVQRQIKRFEQAVYEEKNKGNVVIVPKDHGTFIIYCKRISAEFRLNECIDRIESAIRVFNPRRIGTMFDYPELEEDLSDGFEDLLQAEQIQTAVFYGM